MERDGRIAVKRQRGAHCLFFFNARRMFRIEASRHRQWQEQLREELRALATPEGVIRVVQREACGMLQGASVYFLPPMRDPDHLAARIAFRGNRTTARFSLSTLKWFLKIDDAAIDAWRWGSPPKLLSPTMVAETVTRCALELSSLPCPHLRRRREMVRNNDLTCPFVNTYPVCADCGERLGTS